MLYVNPLQTSTDWRSDPAQFSAQREQQALEEFERVFLYQMLREMRKTVPDGGLFAPSPAQKFFEESLDDALAGSMAESGQLGIAKQIKAQWEQTRAARADRPNGLLERASRGYRLHPELAGLALEPAATTRPASSPGAVLPISNTASQSRMGLPVR